MSGDRSFLRYTTSSVKLASILADNDDDNNDDEDKDEDIYIMMKCLCVRV